jgi:hypothetical protein
MKTLILAVLLASSFFANASGTKEKSVTNMKLIQNFTAQFGHVDNVVWRSAMNNMTKAEFVMDDEKLCAFFDENGNYVAQTREITIQALPKKLKSALDEKAPGAEVLTVFEMVSNDEKAWFVETVANNEKKLWKGNTFGKLSRYYVKP